MDLLSSNRNGILSTAPDDANKSTFDTIADYCTMNKKRFQLFFLRWNIDNYNTVACT
ncbi:hypothetical protein SAMN05421837_103754 [Amycolatopsis pretoriensis]|uniref:Uncharacterized protein n=1 Tax=Amycolatopsis pretoriensis TaxID=218821 RepID=A0A1H5QQ74_9PSEU|nr:hypothetical protein SAMN05421837_103754 [Amycolatopsis pretoriensis]